MTKWLLALLAVPVAVVAAVVWFPPSPAKVQVQVNFPKRLPQVVTVPFRFPQEVSHNFEYGQDGVIDSDRIEFSDGGYGLMTFRPNKTAIEYTRYYPARPDGEVRIMAYVRFADDGQTYLSTYQKDSDGWTILSGERDAFGVWIEVKYHPQSTVAMQTRTYDKPNWWPNMQGVYTRMLTDVRTWPGGQIKYILQAPDFSTTKISTFDEAGRAVTWQDHRGRIEDGFINWQGSETRKLTYALKQGEVSQGATYWVVETQNFNEQGEPTHKRVFNHSSMVAFIDIDGFGPVTQTWNMITTNIPDVSKRLAPENFFLERVLVPSHDGMTNIVYKFMLSGTHRLRERTFDEMRPDIGKVSVTQKIRENGRIEVVTVTANGKEVEKISFEDNDQAPAISVPAQLLKQLDYAAPLVAAHDPDYNMHGM